MSSNELKYPIKYMVQPMIENDKIVAFIAIKCYLLEEIKKYEVTGEITTVYKVIPFYDSFLNKIEVEFNNNKQAINFTVVKRVFDSLEEAQRYSRAKNNTNFINSIENNNTLCRYYDIEYKLLNDNQEQKADIINFSDIRSRVRKRI